MKIVFFMVALFACFVGKICGMGGGVIIKPVLDAYGVLDVETINYLSGCTVFGMCFWSVGRLVIKRESQIEAKTSTPLAVGAAIGGVIGKNFFASLQRIISEPNKAGGVQAILLFFVTFLTLLYTIKKDFFPSFHVERIDISVIIGIILGTLGSFLGIGGGPINVAVLYFFYSMSTKVAAQNSLYIILISQGTGLLKVALFGSIPNISFEILVGMIICGIVGSEIGNKLNRQMSERTVKCFFEASMILILGINIYNIICYI